MLALCAQACGASHEPLSPLCTAGSRPIERALHAAPGRVRLADGSAISDCITRARSDSELQEIGLVLTRAGDHFAARARRDPAAAASLGYLVGAARRGAATTSGIHAELVRRLEQSAAFLVGASPRLDAALRRGMAAGESTG
jgi:hypothetical protein